MPLPADLLGAIAHEDGGHVVLVIGAGCSVEAPTGLPLARACALEAHRKLVADGVIGEGDCSEPSDLSSVADAVKRAEGNQVPLVDRLPVGAFRSAEPNEGHRLAAVLMREQAVKAVVTLNFDLAVSAALANLGNKEVTILNGPQDHRRLGTINLVYLHRNADAVADDWILSTEALESAWQGEWEEVVAAAMLASPVTVFAGLGSPAAVLLESARKIRAAIPSGVNAFQVDPGESDKSEFFAALELPDENYIQDGWVSFMRDLAARLAAEHRNALHQATTQLQADEALEPENVENLCDQLSDLGLIAAGQVRARWMLEETGYLPHRSVDPVYAANLLLAIGLIERVENCRARIESSGYVVFTRDNSFLGCTRLASGRGKMGWLSLEAKLHQTAMRSPAPGAAGFALVAGVGPPPAEVSPPLDITADETEGSIVAPQQALRILTVDELRVDPGRAREAFV